MIWLLMWSLLRRRPGSVPTAASEACPWVQQRRDLGGTRGPQGAGTGAHSAPPGALVLVTYLRKGVWRP